jgi:hypothetical protein
VCRAQSWKLAFATASTAHQVRESLSDMCSRARHLRQMLRDRPFEDNAVKRLIEKCGTTHYLVEGQELVEARSSDSLFIVRSGGVTQRCVGLLSIRTSRWSPLNPHAQLSLPAPGRRQGEERKRLSFVRHAAVR